MALNGGWEQRKLHRNEAGGTILGGHACATVHEWRLLELLLKGGKLVLEVGDFGTKRGHFLFQLGQPVGIGGNARGDLGR